VRLGRIGFWFRLAIVLLKPPLLLLTRRRWVGLEHIPAQGGVIVAVNHISYVDPLCLGDALIFGTRRMPRFLVKSTLFEGNGLVGRTMRGTKQIRVFRNTSDASAALADAAAALRAGEMVVLYPEGTVTRDPGKWPMQPRTGIARLAFMTGAPVVPVAQWGAQEIHDSYRTRGWHLLARPLVTIQAGAPVDLSGFDEQDMSGPVLHAATDAVMGQIRSMLEIVRGEPAPDVVFVPDPSRSA
jgi:1-acyl-sn-glycerol-3-phosphate acyltransferase